MAVSFSITRSTTRFHDSNGNGTKDAGELDLDFGETGVYDPGDILYTRITITNTGDQPATGVTVSDNFAGSTFVDAGNVVSGTPFLNISPIAGNDTFQAIGNTVLRVGTANTISGGESSFFAGNLISNDVGGLAGDSISGFQIDVVGNGTFAGSGVTAKGGHYNIFADGTFNYVNSGSDASLTDGDSFTYTIRDKGFDGVYNTADDLTSIGTVTITFAEQSPGVAHRVWYVDSNAAPGGDGTSANPFQTLTQINGVTGDGTTGDDLDQAGEYIYVENGGGVPIAVTSSITLESGQQLIGDGAALVVAGATLATAGTNSTLTSPAGTIVTLGSGNTIAGINIGNGTGNATGLSGSNFGTLTVDGVVLNTGGQALSLSTGAFAGSGFTSTDSDGGTSNVSLTNVTGTIALGNGALAGATADSVSVSGSVSGTTVTYGGSVTHAGASGALVNVQGGHTGTLTFTGALNASGGTGLQFNNADGTYNFNGTTTLNGGDAGIDITNNSGGTFNFGVTGSTTTNVTNNTGGDAFVLNASNANVTFNGVITDNNGNAVNIDNHDGGTITFQNGSINSTGSGIDVINSNGGAINFNSQVTLSTGANTAITLTTNNGSTTSFNPTGTGLDVTTSSGSGIVANNAGTITIADSGTGNTITITAGGAGAVAFNAFGGTTIAAGGVTFDSISQTGGQNGIVLNGTGTGAFTVLGDGSQTSGLYDRDGSGGIISGTSGNAVTLISANNVTLRQMNLTNPSGDGVNSTGGGSIKLQAVNIDASGGDGWQAVNLGGVNEFTHNSRVTDWQVNNTFGITVTNTDTNFTSFTVENALFTTSATGADGFLFDANGATSGSITVNNSEFTLIDQDAVQINNDGSGTINARVTNNNFHDADNTSGDGNNTVFLALAGSGTLNFEVINNDFTNLARAQAGTGALAVNAATTGQNGSRLNGFIEDNVFTNIFRRDAISFVIEANGGTQGTHTIEVENNSGTNIGLMAARILINSVAGGSVTATNIRYINNTFSNLGTSPLVTDDSRSGIEVETNYDNFASGGDLTTNILFQNNNITNNGSASGVSDTVDITNRGGDAGTNSTMNLTFLGNNFTNATGAFGVDILNSQGTSATGAGATINLDMNSDSVSPNNTTTTNGAGGDIHVRNNAPGGAYRIEDLGANPVTTFLSTRNSNDTVTNDGIGAAITSTGDVTMPTAPSAFIVAAPPPAPPAGAEPTAPGPIAPPAPGNGPPPPPPPAPVPTGPVVIDDGILSQAELDLIVDAAIARWTAAGASDEQIAAMRAVSVSVADLGGLTLGQSNAGTIVLDSDAAGWRWFVDATPGDDSEYAGAGTKLAAVDKLGAAGTRIDLLTVITHELGHQIGLSDSYVASDELMFGTIGAGERRLPGSDDLAGAGNAPVAGAFAFAPVSLGTLPAGQKVIVEFRHVIDNPLEDRLVGAWTGQATVDSDQTSPQNSNVESGNIDGLTLGNLVFQDVNKDGNYDVGTDTLLAGVTLSLFGDTNNNGVFDAGDLYVGYNEVNGTPGYQQGVDTPAAPGTGTALTATTDANGAYSFGSLAPGDYIVRIDSTNFDSGGALEGLLVTPGTPTDPDDNVDNDNSGIDGAGGIVVSRAIRLDYDSEPTAGPGNDTNNTLDFGFYLNEPPVANDDPGLTATEDQDSQYSTELTGNDTDPDAGDTVTIVSAGNATNGSVSVTAGVVTFTPTANFNGTATFEYTIDDGHGNQDTAVATVAVGAVNDPVTTTAPATATLNEDAVDFAVTGLSIADVDATLAPAGVYDVTLSATQGTLKLTTTTGLTFTIGDGDGDTTMTFHGTLADINTALATAKYTPTPDYNGPAQIQLQATDTFGGIVATGSGAATNDSDTIAVTVNSVNDEPAGTDDDAEVIEDTPYEFLPADFSAGFSDPIDGDSFAGVKVTTLPATGTLKLNGVAIAAGDTITLAQLTAGDFTFEAAPGSANTSPTFTFQVQDDGGNLNGGVEYDQSPNTFTLNIVPADIAPVLDLDASGAGTGYAGAYTEGGAAAAISDTDVSITDADAGDNVEGATITITNAVAGDVLTVVGALPGTITVDPSSTATNLILTGTGTQAQYEAAIEQITFSSTSQDPTAGGTNTSRTINVTVTDGELPSNVAVSTISVADDNADAPSGTSKTITAIEDSFRLIEAVDLGFSDVDGTFASVTISAVSGGGIYFDADGTAGGGAPVLVVLPQTYTAQDLIDGKVSFKAAPNANGASLGAITFAVTDDDGNTDGSPNVLTVDVTAVNDSPVLTTGGPIAATEQTAVAILPAGAVADVDLDARNGGNGDYAGASFSVNRNPAANTTEDVFTLVAGPNFTIVGSDLKSGGLTFGTISVDGSAGSIVINFTSAQTPATSALVDEVIQAVRYTNTSNNPPASVVLAIGFDDGSPGGGQGTGATDLDVNLVTVNIAGVNDAPVNSLGGTIGTGEDAVDAWLSGMSISDPDADPATDEIYVTFHVTNGSLEIRTDVAGGIVAGDIIAQAVDTITVQATLNEINATLAASNGLTYTPTPNFNSDADGDAILTVTTNDGGANGSDPGLTGDGTNEEDEDTRTITVSASPDAPVAQPDAVATAENVIGTGSLFANNGSGPDTDADGDTITVSEVNGSPADVGMPIVLASGAILTVNANGTYSYNPNGKFNRLTDGSSGAVNTSTVGDTFSYTVTGGNTVTVTVTVNGVAGPGDWLMGDATDNTITGTPQADMFVLGQGGNDTVSGLAGKDLIYFGGALTDADNVTGGSDTDTILLQGDYSGGLILDGGVTGIEGISMLAGNNTAFGDPGTNLYDYDLTIDDANFAAGVQARINGSALLAGEDFTFDGSAETDAQFVVYGGRGTDDLTGGDGNDIFFFAEGGRFAAGDKVFGGDGYDSLFLRGNYSIDFTQAGYAGAFLNLENLTVSGASDERYARGGGTEFDYSITWDGDLLGGGRTVTINGSTLQSQESLAFNGSDETDGNFRLFGGAGNDVLTGGAGNDLIFGGLRGDTLTGGAGTDIFRYDNVAESNSTERDGIQDFNAGDLIDLSRIDANTVLGGNQAFNFIDAAAFSGTAGELRFENISLGGPIWLVQGDTDGNGVSDFEVVLVISPADAITAGDFIL